MSTKTGNEELRIERPPLLTAETARKILAAMEAGDSEVEISLDLGMNTETVPLVNGHVAVFGMQVNRRQLKKVIKRDTVVFAFDNDGPFPLEIRDEHYAKLVPPNGSDGPPTFELSGIKMHRTLGIDPFTDARTKAEAIVRRGDYVLDTCGGLGYTSTWARRLGAAEVVSVELNEDVIALRRYNPWSFEYLRDGGIAKISGDVSAIIEEFDDGYFDAVIHDPPRFSLAGHLYGEEFIWKIRNALGPGGRLVFYTGEPYRAGRGKNFLGGVEKRLRKLRFKAHYRKELQAFVAEKL